MICFSSLDLFCHLCDQDVKITGNIRSNRLEKCPILNTKRLKKLRRFYD